MDKPKPADMEKAQFRPVSVGKMFSGFLLFLDPSEEFYSFGLELRNLCAFH